MALKQTPMEALGMDWGVWFRDCETGFSQVANSDILSFVLNITVDPKKLASVATDLTGLLGGAISGANKKKVEQFAKKLAKKLPTGSLRISCTILTEDGNKNGKPAPCIGGKRLLNARVVMSLNITVVGEVAGGTLKVGASVTAIETLAGYIEGPCDCKEKESLLGFTGTNKKAEKDSDKVKNSLKDKVSKVEGIGKATENKLAKAGVKNLEDLTRGAL